MKNFTKSAAIALLAALFALPAAAATIQGDLTFSGDWDVDDGKTLANTTSLLFPANDFDVDGATGGFAGAGIGQGDAGSIADFGFDLSGGSISLLEIAGLTFQLDTLEIVARSDTFLLLAGTGIISGDNIMDTAASFSLSANTIGGLNVYSGGITAVPVPGAIWLLGSALMALGVRRRK